MAPATFYQGPPLPTRPSSLGSNHTTYVAPEDPPPYSSSHGRSPTYREPELIEENDDSIPELVPSNGTWDNTSGWGDPDPWVPYPIDYTATIKSTPDIVIDGRDGYEEANWWDASMRERIHRPGSGMLPPFLAEQLHDSAHPLFSVSVTSPDIRMPSQVAAPSTSGSAPGSPNDHKSSQSSSTRAAWSSQARAASPSSSAPPPSQPTADDVRTAVPHPNAYYCPKENGWVILSWKSSSVAPPLAQSFQDSQHQPLPDQDRRKRTETCVADNTHSFGQTNKTHHFHRYENAIDAHKLTPPFRREEWEEIETIKQRRRTATFITDDIDVTKMKVEEIEAMSSNELEPEAEGRLLDLYVCCQCSFYCVASGIIPGVIPRKSFDEFAKEKRNNPPPGKTGDQAVVTAFETIITAIENKLWKGESRHLRINSPGFHTKVGWSASSKRIFEALAFEEAQDGLRPPATETNIPQGRMNRRRLLRAWVEVGAWIVDFKRVHAEQLKDQKHHTLYVQLSSASVMFRAAIGAHPDQLPQGELSPFLLNDLQYLQRAWQNLGLTPMHYTPDLLIFAYYAQCRCDPGGTINYFTHLSMIVQKLQNHGNCPTSLLEVLATERSRDRFTSDDLARAVAILGFGAEGPLRVDYDDEIPENFIENAWKDCLKRSWRDPEHGPEMLRDANEALRILAEAKGSENLRKVWEAGKERVMNPGKAYDTLEVPKDVDDAMLITVFTMRIQELPSQVDRMREALLVIAEVRDSERLRQFLELGQDPGDIIVPIRPDLPRGLNQLGNTCYLNSLLQYFYTIKDLREAVMPMSKLDLNSLDDDKLTDDDLKRHRVGGRLVTRREIARSKKFINQLAELFFHLEYCETPAVTPTIELAKLALVTSRDEEEDEGDKSGTDSSNDTDATLVEDAPSRVPLSETSPPLSHSPTRSPNSVLGKRGRDLHLQPSAMDLDSPAPHSPTPEGYVNIPSPRSSSSPPPFEPEPTSSGHQVDADGDAVMRATPAPSKPPPLPPRKTAQTSDSVMMFGKQHDVAECMDNCMFQIETALLKFDGVSDSQGENSNKTSVVKRLFYGKMRQRITGPQLSRSSIHEKEDLFSHLPVNVANDGVDIYDGLSGYFDDVVEFEGEKRRMEVSLVDLPPLLQIQLQRVQFNRDTLQPYKSQAYVKFGEAIYMDRFMDNADPQKKHQSKNIQSELNACRERARLLVEGKDGPYLSALENTHNFMSNVQADVPEIDDELVFELSREQNFVKDEIDELRTRADRLKDELEAIWRDNTEIAYELTSVFIHRGSSPSWGHYFFYSRHLPDSPDSWFKYNDSDVTVVSKDEVLADTTGSTANPYLLVFARKGSEVVDTVKRFDPSGLDTP